MNDTLKEIENYKNMCQGAFQAYMQGMQQDRREQAKARQEQDNKRNEYCARMTSIGVMPGCESAEEFDDLAKIAATLDPSAARNLRGYSRFCKELNADGNQDKVKDFEDLTGTNVSGYCNEDSGEGQSLAICKTYRECMSRTSVTNSDGKTRSVTPNCAPQERAVLLHVKKVKGSQQEPISDRELLRDRVGENRSTICGSLDNSGTGHLTKTIFDSLGNVANTALEYRSVTGQ
jgi:hypothetical protein